MVCAVLNQENEAGKQQNRLERAILRRLDRSGYAQLRRLGCRCEGRTVVLTGQTSSFFLKQVAQTIVRNMAGVEQVKNLLEVPPSRAESGAAPR